MFRSHRWLALIPLCIVFSLLLTFSASGAKLQLRMSSWDSWQDPCYKILIAEFEKANPDLEIQIEYAEFFKYWQRLMTESLTGTAADITQNMVGVILDYAKMKAVMDLTPLIKKDLKMSDYLPGMFDPYKYPPGKTTARIYGVPFIYFDQVMFYNETLFDEAGIPYPQDSTWQSFLDAAKKLTKDTNNDGTPEVWGFDLYPGHDSIYPWISTAGGRFWDKTYKKCQINQPATMEGLQFYVDLILKHKVAPPPGLRMQGINPFMSGRIAMYMDGTWNLGLYQTIKDFKWDIADPPRGKQAGGYGGPGTYAIPSNCKHPKEAWRFLKFLLSKQGQLILGKGGYGIPVQKQAADEFYDRSLPPKHMSVDIAHLGKPGYTWILNNKPMEYRKVFDDTIVEVLLGKKQLKPAMDEAVKQIDTIIAGS